MNQEILTSLSMLIDAINNEQSVKANPNINPQQFLFPFNNCIDSTININLSKSIGLPFNDDAYPKADFNSRIAHCPSRQRLIEKYYEIKNDTKRKSKFISLYKSKEKMHRIDCMTRKINSCYYQFLVENTEKYQIDPVALDELKNNLKFTSKQKFQVVNAKYPFFKDLYEQFLKSLLFNQLILSVKCKYDKEYLKLFYNHAHNFLWLHEGVNLAKAE